MSPAPGLQVTRYYSTCKFQRSHVSVSFSAFRLSVAHSCRVYTVQSDRLPSIEWVTD